LAEVDTKYPAQLSGGMKKRVGLARAIVLGARILLCDEPTSGLDPIRSRDISNLIKSVARKINATTVITSHDIENSFRIADKLILLNESRIAITGTKDELLKSQVPFIREFVHT
jgi:phospholipid/cholesterol/gamma-HCH transport system ATP-binding protein